MQEQSGEDTQQGYQPKYNQQACTAQSFTIQLLVELKVRLLIFSQQNLRGKLRSHLSHKNLIFRNSNKPNFKRYALK